MRWKGCGRKQSRSNFKVLSRHLPGGLRKTTNNFSQDSRSPGRNFNPGPPGREAGVLTTRPRRSVCSCVIWGWTIGLLVASRTAATYFNAKQCRRTNTRHVREQPCSHLHNFCGIGVSSGLATSWPWIVSRGRLGETRGVDVVGSFLSLCPWLLWAAF
jgi:hypothetical protein